MATGHISRRRRLVASDLSALSSRCSKSCRIFHRFLSCTARVDVVDKKDY
ncbi:uncharacterized protein G2W53_015028 [Senna tora]|uniref:Uncharacterized protein n=1 Tax=Senna tora TaxID=362788 RepID=A0A835C6R9_9FABA|nr:uncharacterized protein G2W53_015028 [Senna tora]